MIIIAHRGNLNGPNPDKENHPDYIMEAFKSGFDVEIDLRLIDNKLYLGHDIPQYEINKDFLFLSGLWIHCKNIEALRFLLEYKQYLNFFFHDKDNCTLTSQGFIWTYPKNLLITNKSIAVMPELVPKWDYSNAFGICTDFIKY